MAMSSESAWSRWAIVRSITRSIVGSLLVAATIGTAFAASEAPSPAAPPEWFESESAVALFRKDAAVGNHRFLAACGLHCFVPGIGRHNAEVCTPTMRLQTNLMRLDERDPGSMQAERSKRAWTFAEQYNVLARDAAKSRRQWKCASGEDWDGAVEALRTRLRSLVPGERHVILTRHVSRGAASPRHAALSRNAASSRAELSAFTRQANWSLAETAGCAAARQFKLRADTRLRLVDQPVDARGAKARERLVTCSSQSPKVVTKAR